MIARKPLAYAWLLPPLARKSLAKGHSAAKLDIAVVAANECENAQKFPHFPWHDCGCRVHTPGDAVTRWLICEKVRG
jgi:hypothetical protein